MTRRNFFILFVLPYLVLGILLYRFYTYLVIEEAKQHVTAILDSTNALRTYIETVQKPVIYRLKKEGKLDRDFFDPKILSASYIARHVLANYIQSNNIPYRFKLAATNPRNPVNRADSFESGILQKFRNGTLQDYATVLEENGKKIFFRAIPIGRNQPSCMRCHSTPERAPKELVQLYGKSAGFGEKIGDMRALISLKIPLDTIINRYMRGYLISMVVLLVLFLLFYVFLYQLNKKDRTIREEQAKRDRLLQETNAQLQQRVEEEIDRRLKQEREMTEQERMLTHQSKLAGMGEMLGNIAHQWRQPLTQLSAIMINLDLQYEHGKLDPERFKEKLNEANDQIQYMSATIDDFRNFFTPANREESFPISQPVLSTQKLVSAAMRNNAIDLRIIIEEDFMTTGFPNEIAQALLNIISNAKEILKERQVSPARIVLRVFVRDEEGFITVSDNGGGIPDEYLHRVFDPYFSTRHASTGTGVGLYMTKVIIEKHNHGHITVENTPDGARFTIRFPHIH